MVWFGSSDGKIRRRVELIPFKIHDGHGVYFQHFSAKKRLLTFAKKESRCPVLCRVSYSTIEELFTVQPSHPRASYVLYICIL